MEGSPPPEPLTWTRVLSAGPRTAAEARWFLQEALGQRDLSIDMGDAVLLTSEVAGNAARHGKEPIDLTISLLPPEGVQVSVFDRGTGFVREEALAQERWHGIHLVDRLSSEWGVDLRDDGTEVWFRI